MADTGDTLQALAAYLGVKCGKITYDGQEMIPVMKGKTGTRRGFMTIVKHLVRSSEKPNLIGCCAEEHAVVDQWLEYKVCQLDRCPVEKDRMQAMQDLDTYLTDKVYFMNHQVSAIDLVLYLTLHTIMADLPHYEKQKLVNLSRWFNNVQQVKDIRQRRKLLTFSKTPLYSGSAH